MTILISDSFTAADLTAINGRTPDITVASRTWASCKWFSAGSASGLVTILSNKASVQFSDEGFAIDCGASDYTVTWYCTLPSSGQFRGGCRFRVQNPLPFSTAPDDEDYYFFTIRFDLASANIRLIEVTNGSETVIGSDVTMSFSYSTTYKMTLVVSGTT